MNVKPQIIIIAVHLKKRWLSKECIDGIQMAFKASFY